MIIYAEEVYLARLIVLFDKGRCVNVNKEPRNLFCNFCRIYPIVSILQRIGFIYKGSRHAGEVVKRCIKLIKALSSYNPSIDSLLYPALANSLRSWCQALRQTLGRCKSAMGTPWHRFRTKSSRLVGESLGHLQNVIDLYYTNETR